MKIREALHLYITVSRWEFLPAVFIGILIGVLIGANSVGSILALDSFPFIIEGILIFVLLFNVGFMVNCWADWKVDELYKTHLYKAVKKLGRRITYGHYYYTYSYIYNIGLSFKYYFTKD